jgi:hypothetical protein
VAAGSVALSASVGKQGIAHAPYGTKQLEDLLFTLGEEEQLRLIVPGETNMVLCLGTDEL